MSDQSRDRELEALFQGLKSERSGQTPDFARMMERVRALEAEEDVGTPTASGRASRAPKAPRFAWAGAAIAAPPGDGA